MRTLRIINDSILLQCNDREVMYMLLKVIKG
uniref:Transposase n=1 Tax=Heterorhabditis bacteriophora TaxID=37862 RepID=A0A1I7WG94_HETBA